MSDSSTRCLTFSTVFLVIFTQLNFFRSIILEDNLDKWRGMSRRYELNDTAPTDDAAFLAGPITISELDASILLLSDTRLATSDMSNAIERIGQLNLKVMKIAMDRADVWDKPEAAQRIMDREHQMAKSMVGILAERVDKLGTLLSKMPVLMNKLRKDHKDSLESVDLNLKDLTLFLEAAKKTETLRNVEIRRESAAALKEWADAEIRLKEWEDGLATGGGVGTGKRLGAGQRGIIATTDEGRALQAEIEAVKAEKAKAVAEFKAVAANTRQEPLLSRHSIRLTLMRKLATMKKSIQAIADGQARVQVARQGLAAPTTTTTTAAAPPRDDPRLNGCVVPPVRDLLQQPPTLKEDPTGRMLSEWMMKSGEVWLDMEQFDRATACFKGVETAMAT